MPALVAAQVPRVVWQDHASDPRLIRVVLVDRRLAVGLVVPAAAVRPVPMAQARLVRTMVPVANKAPAAAGVVAEQQAMPVQVRPEEQAATVI